MYSILIHELGQDTHGRVLRVPRNTISASLLERNLEHYWAWRDIIPSDGPCVAIEFKLSTNP